LFHFVQRVQRQVRPKNQGASRKDIVSDQDVRSGTSCFIDPDSVLHQDFNFETVRNFIEPAVYRHLAHDPGPAHANLFQTVC
jgi:hypothetical protein